MYRQNVILQCCMRVCYAVAVQQRGMPCIKHSSHLQSELPVLATLVHAPLHP